MADKANSVSPQAADFRQAMVRFTIPPSLRDGQARNKNYELPVSDTELGDYIVELNLRYQHGIKQAGVDFRALFRAVLGDEANHERLPQFISKSYYKCSLSSEEVLKLVARDEEQAFGHRIIYKVWPDFPVYPLIDHSVTTIKADAARRSYEATGEGIIWAVIDSGVDCKHIHFGGVAGSTLNPYSSTLKDDAVAKLHRDFTLVSGVPQPEDYADPAMFASDMDANIAAALQDEYGHGTHVAGIIAGGLATDTPSNAFSVTQRVYRSAADGQSHTITIEDRKADAEDMRGVAPQCKIVSLKVISRTGKGSTSNIMLALRYIREELNDDPKMLRVHGVNLSLGYEFDAEMFACGQSPICVEVNRLVEAGVVVVIAAGNTGYARLQTDERSTKLCISNTINDPGNADLAITVGSTHRDAPHTYGVSFFSSKGPTGDGRLKPDMVAPGERITSATTPGQLSRLGVAEPADDGQTYIDDSGTSMAAPHVSGAIAAFLSIRREFIQKPREVKKIFLDSATCLSGRERYFQGHGLIDLMRAIQSV